MSYETQQKATSTPNTCSCPSTKNYPLKKLLLSEDTEQIDRFRQFLRSEISDETLDFWLEVEDFKALSKTDGAVRMAKRIYSTYIANHAPREINTEKKIKDEIKAMIEKPDSQLFEKAQKDVFCLMEKGPYIRFLDRQANGSKTAE